MKYERRTAYQIEMQEKYSDNNNSATWRRLLLEKFQNNDIDAVQQVMFQLNEYIDKRMFILCELFEIDDIEDMRSEIFVACYEFMKMLPIEIMENSEIAKIHHKLHPVIINTASEFLVRDSSERKTNILRHFQQNRYKEYREKLEIEKFRCENIHTMGNSPDLIYSFDELISYKNKDKDNYELKKVIHEVLDTITTREEKFVKLFFGLQTKIGSKKKDYIRKQIGKVYKLSSARVAQIINKGLRKLRHPMRTRIINEAITTDISRYREDNPLRGQYIALERDRRKLGECKNILDKYENILKEESLIISLLYKLDELKNADISLRQNDKEKLMQKFLDKMNSIEIEKNKPIVIQDRYSIFFIELGVRSSKLDEYIRNASKSVCRRVKQELETMYNMEQNDWMRVRLTSVMDKIPY